MESKKTDLKTIPYVGPKTEEYLQQIGIECIEDLKGKNPEEIYIKDCLVKGFQEDRCQLYLYRMAVYYAETENPEKEKLNWWYWKDKEEKGVKNMNFTHCCIVTEQVETLKEFYKTILSLEPMTDLGIYVEFKVGAAVIALYDSKEHENVAPGSMRNTGDQSIMIEIQVEDVDGEWERLNTLKVSIVKPPSNQAWGSRSFYFKDPDGNLLNFYSRFER